MSINFPEGVRMSFNEKMVVDYSTFTSKRFRYKRNTRYIYEVDDDGTEHKLKYGNLIGSGSYGSVQIVGNYVCKVFNNSLSRNEELFYTQKIIDNGLTGIVPVLPVEGNNLLVMMPQVNGDLKSLLDKLRPNRRNRYPVDTGYDIMVFNIMNVLANILYEASKKELYYVDLKLANLLYLVTGENEFSVIVGDVGSFIY